jgi:hypothetical protein
MSLLEHLKRHGVGGLTVEGPEREELRRLASTFDPEYADVYRLLTARGASPGEIHGWLRPPPKALLQSKTNGKSFDSLDNQELDQIAEKQEGGAVIREPWRSRVSTGTALQKKTFAPLKDIVPDLIVEGLVILAGKPKTKKSWMALDIALSVAEGRFCLADRKCQQGRVLYLALEDGERRMQGRITKLWPTFSGEWPEPFNYATQWPRADQGVEEIDAWCAEYPDARLVVIDVLARFRAPASGKNVYNEDYLALAKLQELAIRRSIAILVIHHTRKGEAEDPAEEISGTPGLSGCADAFLVLKKSGAGTTLSGRGRDTEDVELAVQFSDETCRWTILGDAADVHRSDQRARILAALEGAPKEGLSVREIMAAADIRSRDAADKMLQRIAKAGEIRRRGRGRYSLPPNSLSEVSETQK